MPSFIIVLPLQNEFKMTLQRNEFHLLSFNPKFKLNENFKIK